MVKSKSKIKYLVVKDFTHRISGEKFVVGQEFPEGYPKDSIERLLNDDRGAFLEEVAEVKENNEADEK